MTATREGAEKRPLLRGRRPGRQPTTRQTGGRSGSRAGAVQLFFIVKVMGWKTVKSRGSRQDTQLNRLKKSARNSSLVPSQWIGIALVRLRSTFWSGVQVSSPIDMVPNVPSGGATIASGLK